MNRDQTPDSPLNVEEQAAAVVPIYLESAVPLHRLGEARQQEHISRCNVPRRLGITVQDVRRQECKTTDLPLSVLHKWAKVLDLPVAELVEEPSNSLSTPLFNRARLVRLMKTAMAILEGSRRSADEAVGANHDQPIDRHHAGTARCKRLERRRQTPRPR